jgi:drug/metabolite transporter (DMT)-like permease
LKTQTSIATIIETVADGDVVASPAAPLSSKPLFGAMLFAGGVFVLASMDSTTKFLAARFDVPLVVAVRYVVNCLLMLAFLAPVQGRAMVRTRRTGLVLLRAACLACASLFMGLAFQRMPVAESTAVVFLAPTLVVLLARFMLAEEIGALGWLAVLTGFAGVMLIARPGSGLEPVGIAFAVGAAVVTAIYQLLSRVLASSEKTIALLFYTALVGAILFGLAVPWFWFGRAPTTLEAVLLASLGVTSGLGHFLFTQAHRYAPASTLAPVGYLQLVFAGLLGWVVFDHMPDALGMLGMAIIVASGAMILLKPRGT